MQAEGKVITVRDAPRQISLRLIQEPPTTVIVDRVDIHIRGFHFKGNESTLAVELPGGGHRSLENCLFDGLPQESFWVDAPHLFEGGADGGLKAIRCGNHRGRSLLPGGR